MNSQDRFCMAFFACFTKTEHSASFFKQDQVTDGYVLVEKSCYQKTCPSLGPGRDHLFWVHQKATLLAEQTLSCSFSSLQSVFMETITLVCPAEPNSSVPLDVMKLKRSRCSSHRWDWVASVPFEQDMARDMRRVQCHQKRPACRFYVLKQI
uniref:Uncharacterized protein n=1 Tax=Arundo donax TaxID=35708 RepID=A0A0A9G8N2_ARUDO